VTTALAETEKRAAASSSVLAAVGLTTIKIVVGLLTGSLGILAEAAHSGLDLVAALVTFFAIRAAGKPADREHTYGHGKIENLSAMFESGLLLLTCIWIIREAVRRLITGRIEVEVTIWSFAVMITSIVVDVSRSRMLYRVAKAHNSQALEADALHFHTDIWSSAVVLFGLVCVQLGDWFPQFAWLEKADAIAALGVAVIVIGVTYRLGMRTIHALLDTAPRGMQQRIVEAAESVPGVLNAHNVRVRHSGPNLFADLHVLVDGKQTLNEAHELTDRVEEAVRQKVPDVDVTVHPEPYETHKSDATE
jgi:cation diffusion facilitator family transporter